MPADEVLAAIQKTNLELVKIGGAVQTSADGITELLRRSTTQASATRNNGWQTVGLFLAILAAVFSPLVFTLKSHSGALAKHESAAGHEGMDGRVTAIEKVLYREEDRNTKIENQIIKLREQASVWRSEHDRRVLPLNTAQSKKGEELGRLQEILWHNCMPAKMGPYPTDVSGWPRIEP